MPSAAGDSSGWVPDTADADAILPDPVLGAAAGPGLAEAVLAVEAILAVLVVELVELVGAGGAVAAEGLAPAGVVSAADFERRVDDEEASEGDDAFLERRSGALDVPDPDPPIDPSMVMSSPTASGLGGVEEDRCSRSPRRPGGR